MQTHDKNSEGHLGGSSSVGGEGERGPGLLSCRCEVGWVLKPEQLPASPSTGDAFPHSPLERPGPQRSLLGQGPPPAGPRPPGRGGESKVSRFGRRGGGGGSCFWVGWPQERQTSRPGLVHPAWAPGPETATLSPKWLGETRPLGASLP